MESQLQTLEQSATLFISSLSWSRWSLQLLLLVIYLATSLFNSSTTTNYPLATLAPYISISYLFPHTLIMVSADAIRTAVGILGNGIALALFLSPLPTFVRICKKRSVEEFSAVPYVATLLNCMMWVVYGLPAVHPHSTLVLTINGSGMAIELAYVLLFLLYARSGKQRARVGAMLAAETAFVVAVALLALTAVRTHERRSMVVGVLCVVFGTMMYAAPLSVMKLVIETKSVEFMPLSLSLASFFNGLCWTAYALIRFDLYITIPNALGVMFAVAQLVLYAVYYRSTQRQIAERRRKAAEMAEVVVVKAAAAATATATAVDADDEETGAAK